MSQSLQYRHALLIALVAGSQIGCGAQSPPSVVPPGGKKSTATETLEIGARALQREAPLRPLDIYLVGFHPLKDDPEHQMEAHHYCHQVNEDFAQCVLFDGNTATANLNGIEYIISEHLFNRLPETERKYWHPHNGEILSGQLVAPGLPGPAEKALMKTKMNSYGKTWHVWNTGVFDKPSDQLPMGPAMLGWSFSREGEAQPGLVEQRDKTMRIDTREKQRQRIELRGWVHPQVGVDVLSNQFKRPTVPIPGVVDVEVAGRTQSKAGNEKMRKDPRSASRSRGDGR